MKRPLTRTLSLPRDQEQDSEMETVGKRKRGHRVDAPGQRGVDPGNLSKARSWLAPFNLHIKVEKAVKPEGTDGDGVRIPNRPTAPRGGAPAARGTIVNGTVNTFGSAGCRVRAPRQWRGGWVNQLKSLDGSGGGTSRRPPQLCSWACNSTKRPALAERWDPHPGAPKEKETRQAGRDSGEMSHEEQVGTKKLV